MGIVPFHPSTITFQTVPNFLLLPHNHKVRKLQTLHLKQRKTNSYLHAQTLYKAKISSFSSSIVKTLLVSVKCKDDSFGETSDEDTDCRALKIVLRLYSAIKNRDLQGLSDVIGEECRCMSNFVFAFKPLHGKQQVMEFFITLMKVMGNHVEFVIQPTMDDGTNVGLQWTLSNKTHAPLGKGFSFYTAHSYKGKLVIRNVEMFMEPILHIEPLRLKLIGVMSNVIAQMGLESLYNKKERKRYLLLLISLLLMALSVFFFKLFLH
ncbi:hypothetical protein V2J09_022509 [Rumex salicifolius]